MKKKTAKTEKNEKKRKGRPKGIEGMLIELSKPGESFFTGCRDNQITSILTRNEKKARTTRLIAINPKTNQVFHILQVTMIL